MGSVLCANHILLISGSRLKLQKLLDICDSHVNDHFLVFNENISYSIDIWVKVKTTKTA